jgi:hypothetical protein
MADSGLALVSGGLFSLAVACVSGFVAYYTARANARAGLAASRANLEGEIQKIEEQIEAQEAAEARAAIADLRQRYLPSLRYYADTLSRRFAELEVKFRSDENPTVRGWFKTIKDEVTRDQPRADFVTWCYYEGLFAVTTLYYTCSYFYYANEIRSSRPFGPSRPQYTELLEAHLARVTEAFVWDDGKAGIWGPSQEVIGELFRLNGSKMTYTEMCNALTADEASRRAPYLRPLDFYWLDLDAVNTAAVRSSLDDVTAFLDTHDPQTHGLPGPTERG